MIVLKGHKKKKSGRQSFTIFQKVGTFEPNYSTYSFVKNDCTIYSEELLHEIKTQLELLNIKGIF